MRFYSAALVGLGLSSGIWLLVIGLAVMIGPSDWWIR
jgi:hypothetical protein